MMRLIDADALKENARKWIPMSRATVVFDLFDLLDNLADNMPTIDPVKHGKWVDGKYMGADGCFVWHRECSLCGYEREDDNLDKDTNYCPNCGASMDMEDE